MNEATQTAENLYYMDIDPSQAEPSRRDQHATTPPRPSKAIAAPGAKVVDGSEGARKSAAGAGVPPFLFSTASSLIEYCRKHNLTIAQVVWENERAFRSEEEIRTGLAKCK